MKKILSMLAMLLFVHAPVYAGPVWCYGTITQVLTYADGTVSIFPTWRNDWINVCNLNNTVKGISPMTCVAWYAVIKSAASKQPLQTTVMFYQDMAACEVVPTYANSPAPGYLMLTQ